MIHVNVCRYWPGSGDTESAGCTSRLCPTHQGQWGCGNGMVCKFTMHGYTWCICAMSYMLISTCLQYEIWTDFHTVSNEHARPGNKASISQSHTHADGWLLAFCLVGRSCIRLSVIEDQNNHITIKVAQRWLFKFLVSLLEVSGTSWVWQDEPCIAAKCKRARAVFSERYFFELIKSRRSLPSTNSIMMKT